MRRSVRRKGAEWAITLPLLGVAQFQLYRVLDNSLATAPIGTPNTNFVWNKIDQPSPIGYAAVRHFKFPTSSIPSNDWHGRHPPCRRRTVSTTIDSTNATAVCTIPKMTRIATAAVCCCRTE
jgi:hypothetical protein